jgi:hypothetical protein
MQIPPKKKLLTPERVNQVADSLDKQATLQRQTADMAYASMKAGEKSGKNKDWLDRNKKQNEDAITRHLRNADVNDANASRYRKLAEAARKAKINR